MTTPTHYQPISNNMNNAATLPHLSDDEHACYLLYLNKTCVCVQLYYSDMLHWLGCSVITTPSSQLFSLVRTKWMNIFTLPLGAV